MVKSLLILHLGQSNADCHDAGPAFDAACLSDPRIVVPNDGYGYRGLTGRTPRPITGFTLGHHDAPKTQSIGKAAAARYLHDHPETAYSQVIIRSGAKGGRPLCGFTKDDRRIDGIFLDPEGELSPLFLGIFTDFDQIQATAKETGAAIDRVVIPFFHGEADRAADRAAYTRVLGDMMDTVEAQFAQRNLPVDWLMTQPSGTNSDFAGNAWENRLSVLDICQNRPNAYFVAANYGYELQDAAHLSATGKALIGELIGLQVGALLHGTPKEPLLVEGAEMAEQWIDLTFPASAQLNFVNDAFLAPFNLHGFKIAGNKKQAVTEVEIIADNKIRIHCALPLAPNQGQLQYAYAQNPRRVVSEDTPFPFGRGTLCESQTEPSIIVPNQSLRHWIPAFAIPLAEITKIACAA